MKLVAIVKPPQRIEEAVAAFAAATGITLAEGRMRLAAEPPALLARLEADLADGLVAALRKAGLAALAIDANVPTDADRILVHRFGLEPDQVLLAPRSGDALPVAWADVLAVLRGSREQRVDAARTEKSKTFSLGMAAATGGLVMRRQTTKTVHSSETSSQQVLLLYARDGRVAALVEGQVDFSCLGAELQPSSAANMSTLWLRLRARAPGAFHDDRLLRLGRRPLPFVAERETRSATSTMAVTRRDTAASLDVLAEVLRQALAAGLLP